MPSPLLRCTLTRFASCRLAFEWQNFPVLSLSGEHNEAVRFEGQTKQQGTKSIGFQRVEQCFGPNWVISLHTVNKFRKSDQRSELLGMVFLSRETWRKVKQGWNINSLKARLLDALMQ